MCLLCILSHLLYLFLLNLNACGELSEPTITLWTSILDTVFQKAPVGAGKKFWGQILFLLERIHGGMSKKDMLCLRWIKCHWHLAHLPGSRVPDSGAAWPARWPASRAPPAPGMWGCCLTTWARTRALGPLGCPSLLPISLGLPGQMDRQEASSLHGHLPQQSGVSGRIFWKKKKINMYLGKLTHGEQERGFSACCWLCSVLYKDCLGVKRRVKRPSLQVMESHFGACPQIQPCSLCSNVLMWRSLTTILLLYMMVLIVMHNTGGIFVRGTRTARSFQTPNSVSVK